MDTRTGQIHDLKDGQTLKQLAKELGGEESDFVRVKRRPDGTCSKCGGTGRRRAGLFSRRFKPCECIAL